MDGTFDKLDIPLTTEKVRAIQNTGFAHQRALKLKPDTAIVRVLVRNGAGALGSVSIPLPRKS